MADEQWEPADSQESDTPSQSSDQGGWEPVPAEEEPEAIVKARQEGWEPVSDKGGWEPVPEETPEPESRPRAALRRVANTALPMAAGIVGSAAGALMGSAVAPGVGTVGGAIGGGLATSVAAGEAQDWVKKNVLGWDDSAQEAANQKAYPFQEGVTEAATALPAFTFGGVSPLVRATLAAAGGGTALVMSGGDVPYSLGVAGGSALLGAPRPFGSTLIRAGESLAGKMGFEGEGLSASVARGVTERENVRNASQGPSPGGSLGVAKEPTVSTANERVSPGDGPDSGPTRDNPGPQEYGKGKQSTEGGLEAKPAGEIDEAVAAALKPKEPVVGSPEGTGEVPLGPKVEQTNYKPEEPVQQQQQQRTPEAIKQRIRQLEYDRNLARKRGEDVTGDSYGRVRGELDSLRRELQEAQSQQQQQQQKPSTLLKGYANMTADEKRAALGRAAQQQGEDMGGGKPPGGPPPGKTVPPNEPSVPDVKVTPADKSGLKGVVRDIQTIFAPQTLKGEPGPLRNLARETADNINKFHGQLERLHQEGMRSLDPHNELLHNMNGDRRRQLIDRAMGGDHFPDLVPTKQEERMLSDYKAYFDKWKPVLQQIDPNQKFRENYLPGLYENEDAARDFYRRWNAGGDKGMTKEKTFATYEDARNAGLKPLTNDLYELAARYGMRARDFAAAELFKKDAINKGLMKHLREPMPGWEPIRGVAQTETSLHAPENLAAVYNNFVDRGLQAQHPRLYDAAQRTTSSYTMLELGLNGYHFTTMAHEGLAHDMSRAASLLAEGQAGKAAATLLKAPLAPYRTPSIGKKAVEQYLDPNYKSTWKDLATDADVHFVGRAHSPESMASARDSFYKHTSAEPVRSQLGNAWRGVKEEFKGALDDKDIGKAAKVAMTNAARLIQTMSHPLFDVYIPYMKAGAIHEAVHDFLSLPSTQRLNLTDRNGPDWKFAVGQIRKINNSVDNRFGEAVMNHLFMNRSLQQSGQLGMRAFGWAVNSIKEIGGGSYSAGVGIVNQAAGKEGGISARMKMSSEHYDPRLSYLIGFPMALGFASMVVQTAMTGQPPSSLKDLAFPRTGGEVPGYGTKGEVEERLVMPGYLKDVLGWVMHPFTEAYNKLNGLITDTYETARGQDSLGRTFLNPYDSPMDQMKDRLKYFGERAAPISIQNLMKGPMEGSKIPQAMTALGFRSPSQKLQDPERAEAGENARLGREFERREKSLQRQEQARGREYVPRKAAPPPPPEEKRSTLTR